ncbi:MAG TPA: hypothetical protein PKH58_00545 [Paludibacteraceae bacterium]|nr:hypothetical protein [Paludibacteraceae bacterium]HPT42254.1 hypothetical protein [Paludibacteraceae bacterium]
MKSRTKIRLIQYEIAGFIVFVDVLVLYIATHLNETKQFVENLFS